MRMWIENEKSVLYVEHKDTLTGDITITKKIFDSYKEAVKYMKTLEEKTKNLTDEQI